MPVHCKPLKSDATKILAKELSGSPDAAAVVDALERCHGTEIRRVRETHHLLLEQRHGAFHAPYEDLHRLSVR